MQLLDRYLAAIRRNLPARRAADITNELREELLDRVEAQEGKLGRPLENREIGDLLKAFGHPLVVAARYREHQYLIGPGSYPFYLYGVRVTVVIALIILLFAGIIPALMGGDHPFETFVSGLGHAYTALIFAFAWITIVFAVGERIGNQAARLDVWKPEGLPPVTAPQPRSKWASPIEVGTGLIFLIWWAGRLPFPFVGLPSGLQVSATAIWSTLYWPVLALSVAMLAGNLLNWLQPQRIGLQLTIALATTAGFLWAISYLRGHGPWVTVSGVDRSAAEIAEITKGLNFAVVAILSVALLAWGIRAVVLIYQTYGGRFTLWRRP